MHLNIEFETECFMDVLSPASAVKVEASCSALHTQYNIMKLQQDLVSTQAAINPQSLLHTSYL